MMVRNKIRSLWAQLTLLVVDDDGMSTVEYAIGTIAAAAFGAILYTVITGDYPHPLPVVLGHEAACLRHDLAGLADIYARSLRSDTAHHPS